MNRRIAPIIMLLGILFCNVASAATLEQFASAVGRQLNRQVASRLQQDEFAVQSISLFITTPVLLDDLSTATPLSRQMQEELTRWFTQAGYTVQEIRKRSAVTFEPESGELLLTRKKEQLGQAEITTDMVLVGTYVQTPQSVRFNIRLMMTNSREIVAMANITVPLEGDVAALGRNSRKDGYGFIEASVHTQLP